MSSSLKNETGRYEKCSLFVSSSLKNEMDSSIESNILPYSICEPSFHLPVSLDPISSSVYGEAFPSNNKNLVG